MDFYNRTEEIATLNKIWEGYDGRPTFAAVYGRRRCGKSTLLNRLRRPGDVYFAASAGGAALQRSWLANALAEKLPGFGIGTYADYERLLSALEQRTTEPFTLILDEFPLLVQEDISLASLLQHYTDRRPPGKFNLVVCGSSQQMMHDAVLGGTAPLYGRADAIVRVHPLTAGWLTEALRELSPDQIVMEYAVWGGIPRYWETRRKYDSLREAVTQSVFSPQGLYYDEAQRLLLDDMRDITQPISLLSLVAQGVHRPTEMGGRLGRKASDISRPLKRLVALGYLARETPLLTGTRNTKRVLYRLADPFLRFYYRFVHPNRTMLEAGAAIQLWEQTEANFSQYVAQTWEDLCRTAIYRKLVAQNVTRAGRWWGKDIHGGEMEIDLLATNMNKDYWIAVECKWNLPTDIARIRHQLEAKVRRLPGYNNAPIQTYVATRTPEGPVPDYVLTPARVLSVLR